MYKKDATINVLDLFHERKLVKICAPMVRYSKLQFRNLVKLYDCDLTFTPMILADSFCKSNKARRNEFTTNSVDTPLVAQFAANTVHDFVGAAYLASPFCSGVDLNCGCPQKWASEQQLGCSMLKTPEVIYDLVRQCRNRIEEPFTVSVKMRLSKDLEHTVEVCKQLEMCGVSFLTVHARTPTQLVGEINESALKLVKENCTIPIVANGGVSSLEDCFNLQNYTGCDGVMVANGILTNPCLFSGSSVTTLECVQNWLDICYNSTLTMEDYEKEVLEPKCWIVERPSNLTFQCFHHHLVFMLEKILPKRKRRVFNNLKTFSDVLLFIEDYFNMRPKLFELEKFAKYLSLNLDYSDRICIYESLKPIELNDAPLVEEHSYIDEDGKYFSNKVSPTIEYGDFSDIFIENG
ncbi:unnamed protein product [Phaedon cochleariae]|uniref:DUS-like FMN-binding domain-containing protein n=1 Tax=Phaedon cochleariae TaxID=80249 RepID=A0A9P0GSR1_PHACE|nr:unnamed protein product [Phaedon cochleariae]